MPIHTGGHFPSKKNLVRNARSGATGWLPVITIVLSALSAIPAAAAEKTLVAFNTYPPQQTGSNPTGTLLRDASGALYGAAWNGGAYYNGTIFKLTPPADGQGDWALSVLYTFTGGFDGGSPNPVLVMDASGALYGTTEGGGDFTNQGVVFKLTPPAPGGTQWTETVLHYFNHLYHSSDDGAYPSGGLIMDDSGTLYGTTDLGGSMDDVFGFGTVFKLTPLDAGKTTWQETVVYRFTSVADGQNPMSTLTLDATGALYGTTLYGGTGACVDYFSNVIGCGTVFSLTPPGPGQTTWTKTTLHSFTAGADGSVPQGKLLRDASGAVYGTTLVGGGGACTDTLSNVVGCGIVYNLTPPAPGQTDWTESILYTFTGPDGAFPQGGLFMDVAGALFGTASGGGPNSDPVLGGYGLVYKLAPPSPDLPGWTQTVLFSFDISTSGAEPVGELIRDPDGDFFGVTYLGGGSVYEITP